VYGRSVALYHQIFGEEVESMGVIWSSNDSGLLISENHQFPSLSDKDTKHTLESEDFCAHAVLLDMI